MIVLTRNVIWRSFCVPALVVGFFLGFQRVNTTASAREIDQAKYDAGQSNRYAMLQYLVPALHQAGKAGRIYYAASCPPDEGYPYYPYPFPKLNVQPPSKDVSGLAAVRDIFRGDTNVEVEERPVGIIRIRIGKVFDTLLQTQISSITLKPEEQYDFKDAIRAIKASEEVQINMKKLGISYDARAGSWMSIEPAEGLPHLPDSLTNVTMDQALDLVAQRFSGIVVYGTCTSQRYVTLSFTGGPGFHLPGLPPP